MKLSLNWLESYFEQKPNWNEIWSKLTMSGIEVEGVAPVAPAFSGIVVGHVVECIKHPDADKLNLCKVDAGSGELLQIICGASNVKAGVKVPCAKVGAILPDGLHIAERKMRGITSFGMLCSGNEISCPDGVDGLLLLPDDAPLGTDIRDYLGLNDQIVEFKITPNRGDCLSIQGILREIAALTQYKIKPIAAEIVPAQVQEQIKVVMDADRDCPNYLALVIRGVNNTIKLPDHILMCLKRSNVRSISPIVDIANYVMLELGQPLHAFDLATVGGQLQIRRAKNGESLKLLDDTVANLTENTLIICDSQNNPAALAGVMGGLDSGITTQTCDMVLESAYFTPQIIAGIAKQYGVSSDAAYRYERGVDPQLQNIAITRAAKLITAYCGGSVGIINQVQAVKETKEEAITIKYSELNRLIGANIPNSQVDSLLKGLEFNVTSDNQNLTVIPPSYRFDIAIKEDIVEEVARVYGYDNIEPIMPVARFNLDKIEDAQAISQKLKQTMVTLGYSEIVGYAFIEDKYEAILGEPKVEPIKLQNPIAGLNVMRTSLIADLVKVLVNNLNRGYKHIKLFELSRVFHGEDKDLQPLKLAGLVYGDNIYPSSESPKRSVDFLDLKYVVESCLFGCGKLTFVGCSDHSVFHNGRCAKIYLNGHPVGIIGQLHPKLGQELDLVDLPYVFEIDIACVMPTILKIHGVSKFQKVERDLAFLVQNITPVGTIIDEIKTAKINYLLDVTVFDIYSFSDKKQEEFTDKSNLTNVEMKKSVAIHCVFQAEKTLSDEEVNLSIKQINSLVETKFGGTLRTE